MNLPPSMDPAAQQAKLDPSNLSGAMANLGAAQPLSHKFKSASSKHGHGHMHSRRKGGRHRRR